MPKLSKRVTLQGEVLAIPHINRTLTIELGPQREVISVDFEHVQSGSHGAIITEVETKKNFAIINFEASSGAVGRQFKGVYNLDIFYFIQDPFLEQEPSQ